MKILVVGTGYVGLVTGTCLADMGNDVWCVDVDAEKVKKLKKGVIPIYEKGLHAMVSENYQAGRLKFTADIKEALADADICFIAVGTPMGEDGSADLRDVLEVAKSIGMYMCRHMYIIDKSTVPVGTAQKVRQAVQKQLDQRKSSLTFDVISNPEFLKEGTAIADCQRPDRIVIGTDNLAAANKMKELYVPFVRNNENIIFMDIASAEMTKYAANAMLAAKISFMNEIANICERVGADVNKVRLGIGSDKRIGYSFIYAGCGYGGSCFPKDVQALIRTSSEAGYETKILKAVEQVNAEQKYLIPQKVRKRFGKRLDGRTFAVWGLAFKPDTDDMRQSAAITIIDELTKQGAAVRAYDPKAEEQAKNCYLKGNGRVAYCDSKYTVLVDADALILVTEWKEFRQPDFEEIKKRLKTPVIFDGRNQYDSEALKRKGFEYYQIGVGNIVPPYRKEAEA
ncbi:MAG: UDP-glucose/GDP-mannose dehydrogenase family protein [Eubacterium sp.]|nr:UDP-glucose/GDP-mannose dehydrogenase family protein [Eubacterium sp.]